MKSISITTTHTAPYIDLWVDALQKEFDVDVFYVYRVSKEKKWEQYNNLKGCEYSNYSFFQKISIFRKYDFVLLGGWNNITNVLLCFVLMPYKVKVAFFCDHPIIETTKTSFLIKFIKRVIMNSANYIFPACESCKDYLHNTYRIKTEKMRVFPYAHSLPTSNIKLINNNRKEQLHSGSPINIFIANNFLERKGFDVVANTLFNLENEYMGQLKIRIAGTGEKKNYYQRILEELKHDVEFLGWIEIAQYEEEMDKCDVYLHASIFEPFGIPPIDAMQRGKYVITSEGVKSMSHFISMNNERILFYPAHDSVTLSNKLRYIIEHKMSLYENYERTVNMINKSYSLNVNIDAIKSVLL